jgi:hypothetical protein
MVIQMDIYQKLDKITDDLTDIFVDLKIQTGDRYMIILGRHQKNGVVKWRQSFDDNRSYLICIGIGFILGAIIF